MTEYSFEYYIEKAKDAKTLDELFELWKNAHEVEENPQETFPMCKNCGTTPDIEAFKDSFCVDGITSLDGKISKSENQNSKIDILFILKESNCQGKKVNNEFWFNEKPDKKKRENYSVRLRMALEKMKKKGYIINIDDINKYEFGYINLNKRGGYGSTKSEKLKAYMEKYYQFIKREIEILSPQYIILCGCFDVFAEVCKEKDTDNVCIEKWNGEPQTFYFDNNKNADKAKIVNIYHPSNGVKRFKKSLVVLDKFIE